MFLKFEARNPDPQKKFFFVDGVGNTVVTASHYEVMIWNIQSGSGSTPRLQQEAGLITSIYIDDSFILAGNNSGVISLRQTKDGAKLYELNTFVEDPKKGKVLPTKNPHSNLIEFDISKKVNALEKVGRWVFSCVENSRIHVYDVTKEKAEPVLEFLTPANTIPRSLIVQSNTALFSIHNNKDKLSKPDLCVWNPKLNGLEWFYEQKKKETPTLTCTIAFSYSEILQYLNGIEKAGEEVTEFTVTTERVQDLLLQIINNPDMEINFLLLRKLQHALDDYQNLLEKLTQQQSIVRFFANNRLRRNIEVKNSELHLQLNEVESFVKSFLKEKTNYDTSHYYGAQINTLELPYQPAVSEYAFVSRNARIRDDAAREFWEKSFGDVKKKNHYSFFLFFF